MRERASVSAFVCARAGGWESTGAVAMERGPSEATWLTLQRPTPPQPPALRLPAQTPWLVLSFYFRPRRGLTGNDETIQVF